MHSFNLIELTPETIQHTDMQTTSTKESIAESKQEKQAVAEATSCKLYLA